MNRRSSPRPSSNESALQKFGLVLMVSRSSSSTATVFAVFTKRGRDFRNTPLLKPAILMLMASCVAHLGDVVADIAKSYQREINLLGAISWSCRWTRESFIEENLLRFQRLSASPLLSCAYKFLSGIPPPLRIFYGSTCVVGQKRSVAITVYHSDGCTTHFNVYCMVYGVWCMVQT